LRVRCSAGSNLRYRRFPIGRTRFSEVASKISGSAGWKPCDTAGWKPALRRIREVGLTLSSASSARGRIAVRALGDGKLPQSSPTLLRARSRGFPGCHRPPNGTASASRGARLTRQSSMGSCPAWFAFQSFQPRSRAFGGWFHAALAFAIGAFGTTAGLFRNASPRRRTQLHSGTPGLRQSDRNGLFGRASAVLALANMMHLFANELAGLSARGFALLRIPARAFNGFVFWHVQLGGAAIEGCPRGDGTTDCSRICSARCFLSAAR